MILLSTLIITIMQIIGCWSCLSNSLSRRSIPSARPPSASALPSATMKPVQLRSGLGHVTLINPLKSAVDDSIDDESQLTCMDFTRACRWRNVLNDDNMDWWRANGTVDSVLLHQATGTAQTPKGPFAIVATGRAQASANEAILASDRIECQKGNAELRFKYWTSPAVQLHVCLKAVSRPLPDYDYCATVPPSGPGPAFITIPGPLNDPFEIFLRADNFVFTTAGAEGGYVLLDDIEYFGDVCDKQDIAFRENIAGRSRLFDQIISDDSKNVCTALQCSFNEGQSCRSYVRPSSKWLIASNTNIMPNDGHYAYTIGGHNRSMLKTESFDLSEVVNVKFKFYITSTEIQLTVYAVREEGVSILFMTTPSTRLYEWTEQSNRLTPGKYEGLVFEAYSTNRNTFLAIDQIDVTNVLGKKIC